MKKIFALICVVTAGYLLFSSESAASARNGSAPPSAAIETVENNSAPEVTRCGWFSNPTPGNFWLDDKDGEWTIGTQGGHQAEGDYPPVFGKGQWIKTNGNYGYGCACVKGSFNADNHEVDAVTKATARPLAACRKDKALKKPTE